MIAPTMTSTVSGVGVRVAIVAVLVGTAACTDDGVSTPTTPSTASAITAVATLDCAQSIATLTEPDGGEVVLGVVSLETARSPMAMQTQDGRTADPRVRLWAKSGLVVRGGARFSLAVPPTMVDRLAFGWGPQDSTTLRLEVAGCGQEGEWLAFAGGYVGSEVGCLPIVVTAGDMTQTVMIGFGAPCPGQEPPLEPTDT